ncbi:alpha/beta fold hydrolase [Paenibacillus methanolicus]|nr:alpha/beta hydrolase [Paenibacillus methanolicus]
MSVSSDWRPLLERLTISVLFLAGEKNPMWPPSHAEAATKLCRQGTARIVKNAGHALNLEKPKECNQQLLSFIQGV